MRLLVHYYLLPTTTTDYMSLLFSDQNLIHDTWPKKSEWIRTEGRHWITQWNKTVRTERKSKQKSEQESERKSERKSERIFERKSEWKSEQKSEQKSKRKSDPNQNLNRNRNKDANGNKNKQKQKIHIKGKWHLINLKKMLKCPKETNNNI